MQLQFFKIIHVIFTQVYVIGKYEVKYTFIDIQKTINSVLNTIQFSKKIIIFVLRRTEANIQKGPKITKG